MKASPLFLILCMGQAVLSSNPAVCSPIPSVEELERRAITYRVENIKRGYVKMHVMSEAPSPRNMALLYEITFDEQAVRQIVRRQTTGDTWGKPEKIVVTQDRYITDYEDLEVPIAVKISPAQTVKTPREHFRVLNVQALGMDLNGADGLHEAHVESMMNRSDRTTPVVQANVHGGIDTWRIEYVRRNRQEKTGLHVKLWIAPSQGFSVIGIEARSDQTGPRYTFIIESQMKQYPQGDIWYPAKVIKTVKENDLVMDRQVITVEEARFGGMLDASAFSPAGLELKPGREVVDSTSGQSWLKVWDGKELVKPSSVRTAPPTRERQRWLLWTLAVGLALLAIFYFRRVIKSRRAISEPGE